MPPSTTGSDAIVSTNVTSPSTTGSAFVFNETQAVYSGLILGIIFVAAGLAALITTVVFKISQRARRRYK